MSTLPTVESGHICLPRWFPRGRLRRAGRRLNARPAVPSARPISPCSQGAAGFSLPAQHLPARAGTQTGIVVFSDEGSAVHATISNFLVGFACVERATHRRRDCVAATPMWREPISPITRGIKVRNVLKLCRTKSSLPIGGGPASAICFNVLRIDGAKAHGPGRQTGRPGRRRYQPLEDEICCTWRLSAR